MKFDSVSKDAKPNLYLFVRAHVEELRDDVAAEDKKPDAGKP
jgi:hypothetical protein